MNKITSAFLVSLILASPVVAKENTSLEDSWVFSILQTDMSGNQIGDVGVEVFPSEQACVFRMGVWAWRLNVSSLGLEVQEFSGVSGEVLIWKALSNLESDKKFYLFTMMCIPDEVFQESESDNKKPKVKS